MTTSEDPVSQLGSEAAGTDQPHDDLEHWLSDLRTEVGADPSGWVDEDSSSERPPGQAAERNARPLDRRETDTYEPNSGGRHRAAD
jgi:hypothetical protein